MAMDKTFNAAEAEPRIAQAWLDAKVFAAGANASRDESFCIMLPPPNVTGALHVGHAFNHTLMDILTRWHRMRGFDTLFQPGLDHAGIATQLQVEKKLKAESNLRRTDLSREDFLAKVWEWKAQYGGTIVEQDKRLGIGMDYDRLAFTMAGAPGEDRTGHENSPNFHDAVIRVFVDMYEKGLIYRGKRLVNWDPHFETAISDLEVENLEVAGHMWHFKYPLANGATYEYVEKDADGNEVLRETRDYISIATTRPETMLGDGAVAVHPSDERYAPIVGQLCEIPVGPKEHRRLIPIITDEYPDPDFGSGAVKITGAHDFNDYQVARRGGIPCYRLMDTKAAMRADGAPYAEAATLAMAVAKGETQLTEAEADQVNLVPDDLRGLDRFEARKAVVAQITSEGLAVMTQASDARLGGKRPADDSPEGLEEVPLVEAKPIMQPFGDRSKVVVEPMFTDQWFVDAAKIVGPALEKVKEGTVKILPESGEKTYYHWLENIEPWTISRQLWWGHQIPVWFDEDGNEYCAPSEAEAQAKAGEGVTLTRDPDVLDTWFSSGLWPIGTLGWPEETRELQAYHPTSVLITGFDILFFWVARMMMMQLAVRGEIPFHTIYLHQLVRDEKGKKMSKTTGNVLDPLEIVDEFGADALRFTNASMASIGGVLKLSKDRIAGYRNFTNKLWQAATFGEMNGAFEIAHQETQPTASLAINRWILGEVAKTRVTVDKALTEYRFNDAASALYSFTWGTFCDWYLEFTKPVFRAGGAEAEETKAVYAWALDQCLIMLHPIMPFVTEELWGQKARPKMLVHADWPGYGEELVDPEAEAQIAWAIALIENIRSARAQVGVKPSLDVPLLRVANDATARAHWEATEHLVRFRAKIADLSDAADLPKGALTVTAPGATFGLPVADLIDVGKEIARLEKSVVKLDKELGGLNARLSNAKFLERSPAEVVEETRANAAARSEELGKMTEALDRLREIG
jgi:valyl-tRNA synthetase